MRRDIAKIKSTMLGYEDHGIFTCMLDVDYGSGGQGVGGYTFDTPIDKDGHHLGRIGTAYGMEFIARVIRACGVQTWEQVKGRTIFVLQDLPNDAATWGINKVIGIENLPTEPGERFIFSELYDEMVAHEEALR